ncbi:putative malate dehydrogenase [Rhodocollybia butyracea]|uniref:Malate dehydrogenase n=1 Tax=Rhodocollybia butyracea TaxID=206335 RepID=A0A9P5PRG6_9AGAR|nr:putative malate dehydrogenase [Rhodocollybia butyracea]
MVPTLKSAMFLAFLAYASFAAPANDQPVLRCDLSSAVIDTTGTTLPAPKFSPKFLGLGVGTQNYTCTSAGVFTNVGALAELFDISCLFGEPGFDDIAIIAFDLWSLAPPGLSAPEVISLGEKFDPPVILGEHYFVVNPVTGSGLNPKWDFTSHAFAGNPEAFVVGSKIDDVAAPTGASDIDWLYLTNLTGSLANEIYRVDTRGGQAPASCVPGSKEIFVKYTSLYWFTGGAF